MRLAAVVAFAASLAAQDSRFDARSRLVLVPATVTDLKGRSLTVAAQSAGVTVYAATYSALKTAFTSKLPVSHPRRALKPKTPNDATGTVNGNPPGPYNPYPKIPPPEQKVDVLGGIRELTRLHKTNTTEELTKGTGGTTFRFTKQKALEDAIQKLGAELHMQYVVSFVPAASAPGYHTLEV